MQNCQNYSKTKTTVKNENMLRKPKTDINDGNIRFVYLNILLMMFIDYNLH